MHSVMVLCAQRNQVPVGIPILRILIRRPAMVNNACRLRDRLVSAALAAKVLISPKDPLPLVQPAFFLVIHWAITSNPTQKMSRSRQQRSFASSSAPALKALTFSDVNTIFGFTIPAIDGQICRLRIRIDLLKVTVSATVRANQKAVLHQ